MPAWSWNLIWCILGILGGAIFSLAISRHFAVKKRLSYRIKSTPLITESLSAIDDLHITQYGKEIKDLTLSTVEIINTGNVSIESPDFPELGKIHLTTSGTFLKASYNTKFISASTPECAPFITLVKDSLMNIDFDYIGAKDSITIPVYHTGKIELSGTLKNGKIVHSSTDIERFYIVQDIIAEILARFIFRW